MNRWLFIPAAFVVALLWMVHPGLAQTMEKAKVDVGQSDQYGAYLTDGEGRALYLFTADQQGSGDTSPVSNCYDDCAKAWPPLLTSSEPEAGEGGDASLLGTFERKDGAKQVTYNGWPLYYFIKDQGAGDTAGQDKHGFGGGWYLVTPEGNKAEGED
jgi:predicted lipoprotein with Yx(FWY)xxD motif